jgi:hypothetical protein
MPQLRIASFDELVTFLAEEKVTFRHDPDAQVVQMATSSAPLEGSVFIRWEINLPYIQIIAPMVMEVGDERVREVEDAICRVNHAIALPGFAFDFDKKFIYFRLTVPLEGEGISAELMKRMIVAVVNNARDFLLPMKEVVDGAEGGKILDLVIEREKAKQAKAQGDALAWIKD